MVNLIITKYNLALSIYLKEYIWPDCISSSGLWYDVCQHFNICLKVKKTI